MPNQIPVATAEINASAKQIRLVPKVQINNSANSGAGSIAPRPVRGQLFPRKI